MYVTHGSSQPFQQKPGTDKGLSRKDLSRILICNGVTLLTYTRNQEVYKDFIWTETVPAWCKSDRDKLKWRKVKWSHKSQRGWGCSCPGRLRWWSCPRERPREQGYPWQPQDRALKPKHYSEALKSNGICPAGLLTCFRTVTPLFFPFYSFRMGMPTLRLSHCCLVS